MGMHDAMFISYKTELDLELHTCIPNVLNGNIWREKVQVARDHLLFAKFL